MTPKLATILSLMVLGACGTDAPANRHARDTVTNGGGVSSAYRIESPRAGVVWREGETHVIRWSRSDARPVNVGAAVGGKDKGHLAFALPAGTDSLVWQVPVGFVTGFGPDRSDAVRIRVESSDDPRIGAESESFTIAAAGAASSKNPP